jgi:hypothetical protein
MTAPLDVARAAWGEALPDWVEALALECGRSSQNRWPCGWAGLPR